MASKDDYKMPTQVLPILGTRDDIFPRAGSVSSLVFVQQPPRLFPVGLSGAAVVLTNRDGTVWGIPAQTSIHIPLITEHLSAMDNVCHCRGFLPDLVLDSYKYNFSLCVSKFACLLSTSSVSLGQFVLVAEG